MAPNQYRMSDNESKVDELDLDEHIATTKQYSEVDYHFSYAQNPLEDRTKAEECENNSAIYVGTKVNPLGKEKNQVAEIPIVSKPYMPQAVEQQQRQVSSRTKKKDTNGKISHQLESLAISKKKKSTKKEVTGTSPYFRQSMSRLSNESLQPLASKTKKDLPRQSLPSQQRPPLLDHLAPSASTTAFTVEDSAAMNNPSVQPLMAYRPSFYVTDTMRSTMSRDSLMSGRQTDMTNVLNEMDEGYRLSVHSKIKADANLPLILQYCKIGKLNDLQSLLNPQSETLHTDLYVKDSVHGQNALHVAIRNGQFHIVQYLCSLSESLSSQTTKGSLAPTPLLEDDDNRLNTPLHLASAKSRRITKYLLDKGADVHCYNERNQTPLGVHILTTKRDDPLMTEMLLQFKADPNACVNQSTLLHTAIDRQLYEIAGRLVRYGARLDAKDSMGAMVFDKVNRKVMRKLLSKISYPPVWVPNQERSNCMLCTKKFKAVIFGIGIRRKHHCRHCGRLTCGECSHLSIEAVKFPKTFNDRIKRGSKANKEHRRVCKTCYAVFKERNEVEGQEQEMATASSRASQFYQNIVNVNWEPSHGQSNNPIASR